MMRNSMGACAMMQVASPCGNSPRGGLGLGQGLRGGGGGGGGGGGMFYPVAFSSPTPRYVYSPSAMRPTALPFFPSSSQPYYEPAVGVAKRSPDQVASDDATVLVC